MMAMRGRTGKQVLVSLDMGGKEMSALLREMQNDVLKGTPIHVDFSEVSLSEKVRITVPIYLVGEAKGVKIGGGVLEQTLRTVDIDVLPADIPRGEVPVAVVKAPDAVPGATPAAGAAAAPAEAAAPEVIKKGKEEEAAADKKEEKK